MKKIKAFLKYSGIIVAGLALTAAIFIVKFLYTNEAPVLSGSIEHGITYKNNLKLDLYRPTKKVFGKSPAIIFVHGGAWIGGTKVSLNFNRFNGAFNTLRENGYTIVSPDYSLAGKTKQVFPECILDLYDAIEWTKKNAPVYDVDTTNLGILGESAGAHIAMMVAFSSTTLEPEKYPKTDFTYVVDVYGPNDLRDLYKAKTVERIDATVRKVSKIFGSEFNIKEYVFGFNPSKDSVRANELLEKFSPINRLHENKMPVLIIHGNGDQVVPVQQSITLKQKMDGLRIPNEIHIVDSVDHNFRKATQQQLDSIQVWVSDFVIRNYKKN